MQRKANLWVLMMLGGPLLILAVPFFMQHQTRLHVPLQSWLLNIAQGLFYLVAVGSGLALIVRSVWGAEEEQGRKVVGLLCVVLSLASPLVLPTSGPFVILGVVAGLLIINAGRKW